MSSYEIYLLAGSLVILVSALMFFGAVTSRKNVMPSIFVFLIGGVTLYYAQILSLDEMKITDLPDAIYKLVGRIL